MRKPPYFQVGTRVKAFNGYHRGEYESGDWQWTAGEITSVTEHEWGASFDKYYVLLDNGNTSVFKCESLMPLSMLEDLALGEERGGWCKHNPHLAFYGQWS